MKRFNIIFFGLLLVSFFLFSCSKAGSIGEKGEQGIPGKDSPHYNELLDVAFDPNGGTFIGESVTSKTVTWGDTIDLPIVEKEHFDFIGWVTGDTANDGQFYSFYPVFRDLNLVASFIPTIYTMTLDLNGGSYEDDFSSIYCYGDKYELPTKVTKEGYEFIGWTVNNQEFAQTGTYNFEDITVNANYKPLEFTINLDLDGGKYENETSISVLYDDEYQLPSKEVTKEGYIFVGWYLEDQGWETTGVYKTTNNITLKAKYEEAYSFELDYNGGIQNASNEVLVSKDNYDKCNYSFPIPSKENYKFLGYYLNWYQVTDSNGLVISSDNIITSETNKLVAKYIGDSSEFIGDFMYFGKYPQTAVLDNELITSLESAIDVDDDGYIEYNDKEYKYEDKHYYLVEPILWRVMEDGLIVSDIMLDCLLYLDEPTTSRTVDGVTVGPKSYEYSDIRAFLNGYDGSSYNATNYDGNGFVDIAFTESERSLIKSSVVDNSLSSTKDSENVFICDNTNDLLFLLSYEELMNTNYGYVDSKDKSYTRVVKASDYAMNKYGETTSWWSRSPSSAQGIDIRIKVVRNSDGTLKSSINTDWPRGVVIAFRINSDK